MDITIKIEAPQLADAINALAVAIAGNIELILDGPGARAAQTTTAAAVPTAPTTVTPAPAAVPVTPQPVVQAEQPQATSNLNRFFQFDFNLVVIVAFPIGTLISTSVDSVFSEL